MICFFIFFIFIFIFIVETQLSVIIIYSLKSNRFSKIITEIIQLGIIWSGIHLIYIFFSFCCNRNLDRHAHTIHTQLPNQLRYSRGQCSLDVWIRKLPFWAINFHSVVQLELGQPGLVLHTYRCLCFGFSYGFKYLTPTYVSYTNYTIF